MQSNKAKESMNALSQKQSEQSLWVLDTLRGYKETPRTILACLPVQLHTWTATIPGKRNPDKTPHKKMGHNLCLSACMYACLLNLINILFFNYWLFENFKQCIPITLTSHSSQIHPPSRAPSLLLQISQIQSVLPIYSSEHDQTPRAQFVKNNWQLWGVAPCTLLRPFSKTSCLDHLPSPRVGERLLQKSSASLSLN